MMFQSTFTLLVNVQFGLQKSKISEKKILLCNYISDVGGALSSDFPYKHVSIELVFHEQSSMHDHVTKVTDRQMCIVNNCRCNNSYKTAQLSFGQMLLFSMLPSSTFLYL